MHYLTLERPWISLCHLSFLKHDIVKKWSYMAFLELKKLCEVIVNSCIVKIGNIVFDNTGKTHNLVHINLLYYSITTITYLH